MKYRRLLKMVLSSGLLCTACGFVGHYLWDYGFSAEGMTVDFLFTRGLDALKTGFLYGGLYFAFPMWLALEKFPRRKSKTTADLPLPRSSSL